VFLIMGYVLAGYMFRSQFCVVGGLEAIVFGSIRSCVMSFRPSSPLRLPHLKCLLCYVMFAVSRRHDSPPHTMLQPAHMVVYMLVICGTGACITIAYALSDRHPLLGLSAMLLPD